MGRYRGTGIYFLTGWVEPGAPKPPSVWQSRNSEKQRKPQHPRRWGCPRSQVGLPYLALLTGAETPQFGMLSLLRFLKGEEAQLSPNALSFEATEGTVKGGFRNVEHRQSQLQRPGLTPPCTPSDRQPPVRQDPIPIRVPASALALLTPISASPKLLLELEGAGMDTPALSWKCWKKNCQVGWGGRGVRGKGSLRHLVCQHP